MHALDELSERSVEMGRRVRQFRRLWPEVVTGGIDLLEVQADERRPLRRRQSQPCQRLLDAVARRELLVVGLPIRRSHAADCGLGAGPEHRRRRGVPAGSP